MSDTDIGVINDLIKIIHDKENIISHVRHDVRDSLCYPKMLIDTQDITDDIMIQSIQECLDATTRTSTCKSRTTVASVLSNMGIQHEVRRGFTMNIPEPTLRMIINEMLYPKSKVCTVQDKLVITNGKNEQHDLIKDLLSVYGYELEEDHGSFIIATFVHSPIDDRM